MQAKTMVRVAGEGGGGRPALAAAAADSMVLVGGFWCICAQSMRPKSANQATLQANQREGEAAGRGNDGRAAKGGIKQ